MIFGYCRVSTKDRQQNSLAEQERKLREAGAEEIFVEERSGGSIKGRDQLQAMLAKLREGDQVISTKLDRLSRSLPDFVAINELIDSKGATLRFIEQDIRTDTPAGRMMLQMISVFSSYERDVIRDRVQAGVDRAKREGKRLGRPPVDLENDERVVSVRALVAGGQSVASAARVAGVSRQTAHRWVKTA